MSLVLALDQGTTGSTAIVVDAEGRVLARGYRELTQHFPRPGWVEHDPAEMWRVTLEAGREALGTARISRREVAAIGITNQRETTVLWDRRSGEPLHRAIVWQDRRTAERCRALDRALIGAKTGLVPDPYFSASKLEWLLTALGPVRGAAFGTVDAWLVHKLTKGRAHVTDPSNASRTMLYDIETKAWDEELLKLFGVPREILPEVRPSSGIFGLADAEWFGHEIPVAGIAGDQQAALFGQGCFDAGGAKNTYGTGAFLLLNTGQRRVRSSRGLLTTIACDARGEPAFALEGSVFIAGAALQWLRDGLGVIRAAAESEELARSVPDTGGVVFVPAFVGLGAPHWDADARGAMFGLTRGAGRAHLARAALEAMAFSTKEVLDAMTADAGLALADLRVDGGAAANDWLMQFQADVLGVPVRRPDLVESTALGAAGLAGLATGVWRSADEFFAARRYEEFRPGPLPEERWRDWQRAVRATLGWAEEGRAPRDLGSSPGG
ncbi:MAG: glycerol kinase GlpK [Gemmatimonadetes bacterium]|nr:glycerol kinase GlpK [Gemmatimonadota bacterium]